MLHNLIIMLFGISPIFCLLCSFLCFLGMHYADNLYLHLYTLYKNDHDRNKMPVTYKGNCNIKAHKMYQN